MEDLNSSSTRKRSNADPMSDSRQHRQKREKYTSVACNECKKRKIKCSGHTICQRCENMGLRCIYAPPPSSSEPSSHGTSAKFEAIEAKLAALQKQVNQIQAGVNSNRTQNYEDVVFHESNPTRSHELDVPFSRRRVKQNRKPAFFGPTSSGYGFDVGKSSLKSMGLQADNDPISTEPESVLNTPHLSPKLQARQISLLEQTLTELGNDEALRLIGIYSEELFPIYPFLDISQTISHLHLLQSKIRLREGSVFGPPSDIDHSLFDNRDSDILMMVLASALTIEGLGQSTLADELVDAVEASRSRRSRAMQVNIKEILVMTMMSVYHFHCDEDILAWRTIGVAARMTQEIGLYRRETLLKSFPDPEQRSWAIKIIWCVYILDRRWAVGTGLPYALGQSDIDLDLPEPDDTSPYLERLIAYGRISSKVWKAVNTSGSVPAKTRKEESDYLDFQIQQWLQATPPELQLLHPKADDNVIQQPRSLHRLRVLLYVRANHLRILVHRHNLLSATNIAENVSDARAVVEIAKDTIQVLAHLNRTSNIYHKQQVCFNYFLVSALAALFLAVCHGPTYFSEFCRTEFYLALDLVKGFSSKSSISRRLWKTIRDLNGIGPKLGLGASPNTGDIQGSATVTSGYLPSSNKEIIPVDHMQPWEGATSWLGQESAPWIRSDGVSGLDEQMTCALIDLYGVATGTVNNLNGNGRMYRPPVDVGTGGDQGNVSKSQYPFEDNATVSKLLGDLF